MVNAPSVAILYCFRTAGGERDRTQGHPGFRRGAQGTIKVALGSLADSSCGCPGAKFQSTVAVLHQHMACPADLCRSAGAGERAMLVWHGALATLYRSCSSLRTAVSRSQALRRYCVLLRCPPCRSAPTTSTTRAAPSWTRPARRWANGRWSGIGRLGCTCAPMRSCTCKRARTGMPALG